MKSLKLATIYLILLFLGSIRLLGAENYSIQLMAAKPSWTDKEFFGHAFMCITTKTSHGPKEDCYGFYPRHSGMGAIAGPGYLNSEFEHNPSRFGKVTISISKPITQKQYLVIFNLLKEWDKKSYNLTNQSCIDFVDALAHGLGWHTPARVMTDLPEDYLRKLAQANP